MRFAFGQPWALLLLPLVPLLLAVVRYGRRKRHEALQRFGRSHISVARRQDRLQHVALLLLILALARPQWREPGAPPAPKRTGDIVFLLDVSRSMLSDDVAPNRLEVARQIIGTLAGQLQGERVALVTFAGNSAIQCPLTLDYAYFREQLASASMDSVTRGGTRLGDAITFASQTAFDNIERGNKVLVLLTDGGDQESSPAVAAATASKRGIRLAAIGVGSESGAVVPISESDRMPFLYRGQPVATKLEANALHAVAAASLGGTYFDSALNATLVYHGVLAARGRAARAPSDGAMAFYPLLLACGILLLAADMSAGERRAAVALGLVMLLAPAGRSFQPESAAQRPAPRDDAPLGVDESMAAGDAAFGLKNYTEAMRSYAHALTFSPQNPVILFNLATALYASDLYGEAAIDFRKSAEYARDPHLGAKAKLGAANCAYRTIRGRDAFAVAQALSQVLAQYRDAWTLDSSLADAHYNIEVLKRRLEELRNELHSASSSFMAQSAADLERQRHNDADDILREGRSGGTRPGDKRTVDRDW